jgi:hypothetical protein
MSMEQKLGYGLREIYCSQLTVAEIRISRNTEGKTKGDRIRIKNNQNKVEHLGRQTGDRMVWTHFKSKQNDDSIFGI